MINEELKKELEQIAIEWAEKRFKELCEGEGIEEPIGILNAFKEAGE